MNFTRTAPAIVALATLALGIQPQAAHAASGADVFNNNCALCHSPDPGTTKLGPSLAGVVGRKSGTLPGYAYSPAMAKAGLTWDKATLDKYLTDPQATVPGTKMIFLGLKDPADRSAVIDYLASLKG